MSTAHTTLGYLSTAHMTPGIVVAVEYGGQLVCGGLTEISHDARSRLDPQTRVVISRGEARHEITAPPDTPCDLSTDAAAVPTIRYDRDPIAEALRRTHS